MGMRYPNTHQGVLVMVGLCASWAFVLAVFWSSGLFGALIEGWNQRAPEGRVHFNIEEDPKVGDVVALPPRDIFGRDVKEALKRGKSLVIYGGSCSDCSLKVFDYRRILTSGYGSVILVFRDKEEVVKEKLGALEKDFYMVLDDEDRRLGKFLNAFWTPRFFLLDEHSRIVDFQRYVDSVPSFLKLREGDLKTKGASP